MGTGELEAFFHIAEEKAFLRVLGHHLSLSVEALSFPLQVRPHEPHKTRYAYFHLRFYQGQSTLFLGNYSVAGFELTLRRKVSHYIITYYLPSGMFVIVSWISFLVPPEIVPGRMTLLVTVFLVLVNIFNTITTNIPKAEGLTGNTMKGGKKLSFQTFSLIAKKVKASYYFLPPKDCFAL